MWNDGQLLEQKEPGEAEGTLFVGLCGKLLGVEESGGEL